MPKKPKKILTSSWDLAGQSVKLVRSHFTPFTYIILLPGLLYSFGALIAGSPVDAQGRFVIDQLKPEGIGIMALSGLWILFNLGPATHLELSATKERPKLIRDYYGSGLKDTVRLAVLQLICGLIIIAGLLALIVPGLIAIRMLLLAPYYLVDKKLGIIEAIKTSARNSKPVSGYIWGIIGVQLAVTLFAGFLGNIPAIGIILSVLATYSIVYLQALRYRTIEG